MESRATAAQRRETQTADGGYGSADLLYAWLVATLLDGIPSTLQASLFRKSLR